ncbi:MFS transporter, partial [Chloroflexota bacterium]
LQYYTKDEYRGRVMSILMMEFGLMSLGVFSAGLIAEAIGVQWALGGFATILVLLSIAALAVVPRIRKLD